MLPGSGTHGGSKRLGARGRVGTNPSFVAFPLSATIRLQPRGLAQRKFCPVDASTHRGENRLGAARSAEQRPCVGYSIEGTASEYAGIE